MAKTKKSKGLAFDDTCVIIRDDVKCGTTEAFDKMQKSFADLSQLYTAVHKTAVLLSEDIEKRGQLEETDKRILGLTKNVLAPAFVELNTLRGMLPSLPVSYTMVGKLFEVYYTYLMLYVCRLSELFGEVYISYDRIHLNYKGEVYVTGIATTFESSELFKLYKGVVSQLQENVSNLDASDVVELFMSTQHFRKDFWGVDMVNYLSILSEYMNTDWELSTVLSQHFVKKEIALNGVKQVDADTVIKGNKSIMGVQFINSLKSMLTSWRAVNDNMNLNKIGITYMSDYSDLSKYIQIGCADDLIERIRSYDGSTSKSSKSRIYATYQINTPYQNSEILGVLLSYNMRLNLETTIEGYKRAYSYFETSVDLISKLTDCIGKLHAIADNTPVVKETKRPVASKSKKESEPLIVFDIPIKKLMGQRGFSFTALGVPIGATLTYRGDKEVTVIVADDQHVEYDGEVYALATLVRKLKGTDSSHRYYGTKYFDYNGIRLYDLHERKRAGSLTKTQCAGNSDAVSEPDTPVRAESGYISPDVIEAEIQAGTRTVRFQHRTKKDETQSGRFAFSKVGIPIGTEINYIDNPDITAIVRNDKYVEYKNDLYTLPELVYYLKRGIRDRRKAGVYRGKRFFTYKGETLADIQERVEGKGQTVEVEAGESRAVSKGKPIKHFSFKMLNIPVGSRIRYVDDSSVAATVIDGNHVEYAGNKYTLSELIYTLKHGERASYRTADYYKGERYFTYKGKLLSDIRKQISENPESVKREVPTDKMLKVASRLAEACEFKKLDRKDRQPNKQFNFSTVGLPVGAKLTYINNPDIVVTVANQKSRVAFRGETFTLSELAYFLIKGFKYHGMSSPYYNGTYYFAYEGELLADRKKRLGV